MSPSMQVPEPRLARTIDFSSSYQDGDIYLLLGTTIFILHRDILAIHSSYFRVALALAGGVDAPELGKSVYHPLAVPDVLPSAFAQITGIIYGRAKLDSTKPNRTPEDMVALIRAAHTLQFGDILKKAAKCYERSLPSATRLALALSCGIAAWAAPAFAQLVLLFEDKLPNPYGLLNDPDIPALVYLARQEVAKARLAHITRRGATISLSRARRNCKGPSPVAFSDALVITRVLPYCSRAAFVKEFAAEQVKQVKRDLKIPDGPVWQPTRAQLEQWVPHANEEIKMVESLWRSRPVKAMENLFE